MRRGWVVLVLLLVTACGGGDGESTSPDTSPDAGAIDPAKVDVCALLDEAAVQQITGVSQPFVADPSGEKCFWAVPRPGFGAYVEIRVSRAKGLDETGRPRFDGQPCTTEPLAGVGEAAEVLTCPPALEHSQRKVMLRAFQEGILVTVLVNDTDVTFAPGQLASVAQKALSRLGSGQGGA